MEHNEVAATTGSRVDGRIVLLSPQLKALRLRRGLSQEALAEYCFERRLCVSIATIKRAESGKSILYRTARHLAAAHDVQLESLLPPTAEATPIDAPIDMAPDDAEPASRSVVLLALPHQAALAPYQRDATARLVAQFGGVQMAASDGTLVAVFGIPQAYRSDTARCVECAAAISERLGRTGGDPVVGRGEWSAGQLQVPATITQACSAPAAGTARILVELTFAALLIDQFDFQFPGRGSFPPDFAVLQRSATSAGRQSRPFIGRYSLLQQFKAILDAVQSMQYSQVVHIRGDAGIGKSRLVREFGEIACQWGFTFHQAAILDFGVEARATPWGQLVRGLLALPASHTRDETDDLAWRVRQAGLDETWEMPLRALLGLDQRPDQYAMFAGMEHAVRQRRALEALQALVLRAVMTQPTLIVIEDIHWADAPFLDMFAQLLSLTREGAVIWLTTSRHDGDPLDAHVRPHCADQPLTVFDLAPLRPAEAEALALALQHSGVDEGHRSQCIDLAGGNALFLTQLLLSPPGQVLPDSLRHLVQSQLDRLAPPDRRALLAASAIGQQFPMALLRQVLDDPTYRPDLPERAHLLKPSASGTGAFVHDLVMHCIYESIAPAQRRQLHRRIAALYRDSDTVLWARHLDRADDPGTCAAYLCAIREQLERYAYDLAIELAAQALSIRHTEVDGYALNMLAAEAAARSMRNDNARASFERARALAPGALERLHAMLGLAAVLNVLDRTDEEEALLNEALPLAHEAGSESVLAQLLYLKGNIRFPRGEFVAGRGLHEQALRHARASGEHGLEARSLSGLGDSLYAEGRMSQAHAVFADCLALCHSHKLVSIEASNLFMRGTTRIYLGRTKEALADALDSAVLGRRVGNRRAEIVSRLTASWALLSMGRPDEARAEIAEGLQLAHSMGAARFEPFLNESLARVSFVEGRRSLALTQIAQACEAMERLKLWRFIGPWLLGTLALLSDDGPVRQDALRRGAAMLGQGCVAHNEYRFRLAAAEIALLEGDASRAAAEMASLGRATAADPCEWVAHPARVVQAYGRWLADPCDDTRVALHALRRDAVERGFALATPRLDAALQAM